VYIVLDIPAQLLGEEAHVLSLVRAQKDMDKTIEACDTSFKKI